MKKCQFCGKEIDDFSRFCPNCGSEKFVSDNQMPINNVQYAMPENTVANNGKKKGNKGIVLAIVLVFIFAPMIIGMISSLIPCRHEYEQEVKEATYSSAGLRTFTCKKCNDSYTEEIPMLLSVEVEVLDKYTHYEPNSLPGRNQTYVLMEIEIKNVTDKDIAKVEGVLTIKTGTTTLYTNCTFEDEIIPAGESIVVKDYGFSTKRYGLLAEDPDANTIYRTPHEQLTYEFEVEDIAYADEI